MGHLVFKKTCEWCGRAFTAQTISTRFCCHTCSNRAYKAKKRHKVMADYAAANPVTEIDTDPIGNLEVMSPRKAALYLGIGKTTIYRYLESGQLKALKLASKTLIRKTDLDELFVYNPSALTPPPKKERKQDKEYYTARQIMELLGMSMAGVCRLVQREKVPSVKHRGLTYYEKPPIDRIKTRMDKDPYPDITEWYTTNDIVEKYGKTPDAIYSIVYENGIPKKKIKTTTYYSKLHVDSVLKKTMADKVVKEDDGYYTIPEIMEKYSFTRDQVDHYLRYYKVPRVKVGRIVKIVKKDFDEIFAFPTK